MVCDIRATGPTFARIDLEQGDIAQARYLQTENVAVAGRPAKAVRSRLLDGRPQPAERRPQIFVRDLGETGCDAVRRFRIAGARRRALAAAKRGLPPTQPPDRLPAEEAMHPLEDDTREVLDFDRRRSLDPQHEGSRLGRVAAGSPRPLDFFRLRMGRDLRAHDVGPAGDEFARGEALLGE